MRSVTVNVLLGVGVTSEMTGWCSERCSKYESSQGSGLPRKKELPREQLGGARKVLCWHVLSYISGVPDEVRHVSRS